MFMCTYVFDVALCGSALQNVAVSSNRQRCEFTNTSTFLVRIPYFYGVY